MEDTLKDTDLFEEYLYKPGQEILIDASFLRNVVFFCQRVIESQPKLAALLTYPKEVQEVKDTDGILTRVDIVWEEHNKKSFNNTAFESNGAVPIVTDLSMVALQTQNALLAYHLDNINNGIAVKKENGSKNS